MKAEMWDVRGNQTINLAAAFRTDSRGARRTFGRPTRRADEGMDNRGKELKT